MYKYIVEARKKVPMQSSTRSKIDIKQYTKVTNLKLFVFEFSRLFLLNAYFTV